MYILVTDAENENEDAILDGESLYLERIQCSFERGLQLPTQDIASPISFTLNEFTLRGKMTDHLSISDISGPIFSFRARSFFEKLRVENIQYFHLKLIDKFGEGRREGSSSEKEIKQI